jgi:hypothetical protein
MKDKVADGTHPFSRHLQINRQIRRGEHVEYVGRVRGKRKAAATT